jgi:hypothetical protein
MYHPRACTGIFGAKIRGRGLGFGLLGHCRLLAVSNRSPKFRLSLSINKYVILELIIERFNRFNFLAK